MMIFIIGHRGVGKTTFAKRYVQYLADTGIVASTLDLDQYIEKREKKKVPDIFKDLGEKEFRKLEKTSFEEILQSMDDGISVISLGAGFDVSQIPKDCPVLWIQRDSDKNGRIFLDRPRLENHLDPISEFKVRFEKREPLFQNCFWEEYVIPEGIRDIDDVEQLIFSSHLKSIGGTLTLNANDFKNRRKWNYFIEKRLYWGLDYFEVRNDLLILESILDSLERIPKENILFSYRKGKLMDPLVNLKRVALIDWALELGEPRTDQFNVISLHHRIRGSGLEDCFKNLEKYNKKVQILKLAVEIHSFEELLRGHEWQQKDPKKRCFLPRSNHGKWEWYRLFMKGKMPLNFIREGRSKVLDQPTLHAWLRTSQMEKTQGEKTFAAVLGSPVSHSHTPTEHYKFFLQRKMSVFAIDILTEEFSQAINVLTKLGLRAAAVTSPLKELAFNLCSMGANSESTSDETERFKSVNTIIFKDPFWKGYNTDYEGLRALLKIENASDVAVWGGGGTLSLLQDVLPSAHFFSARMGTERIQDSVSDCSDQKSSFGFVNKSPKYLVWAAPRADGKNVLMPPTHWKPEKVIDLNYREDSGGKEYAQLVGSQYQSGETMFLVQAEYQRKIWGDYL
jgi:shikimate 5-dehydrogenase/shikimate kinase